MSIYGPLFSPAEFNMDEALCSILCSQSEWRLSSWDPQYIRFERDGTGEVRECSGKLRRTTRTILLTGPASTVAVHEL